MATTNKVKIRMVCGDEEINLVALVNTDNLVKLVIMAEDAATCNTPRWRLESFATLCWVDGQNCKEEAINYALE